MISSNLAVSHSFGRSKSRTSFSSPLVDPSSSRPPRGGRSSGKRSASSPASAEGSALGGVRGRLLLPNLQVSGSRRHPLA